MKTYDRVSLLDDGYINPTPAVYDNGTHPRNLGQITSISVHHDAMQRPHSYNSVARYKAEAATHYQRLGPGLQYHFKIDNVGTIFQTRPLDEWLYVVGSQENVSTIAICLDGYFHPPYNETPTREQYEALAQLLEELCEHHPEFPATWPDVRPHRDFSSTACCGDNLAPFIYSINSKADAYNIPTTAVYDWPEEQTGEATPPQQPPAPAPSPINFRVFDLTGRQVGAYSVEKNAWNKYESLNGQAKIVDGSGNDVTQSLRDKYAPAPIPVPEPPVIPPTPPADPGHDYNQENNTLLKAILEIVQRILDAITKIFK
jgi:hypothetical protein